jgi:uncharacterized membrane protein
MKKIFFYIILAFLFISFANAATIYGSIYDLSLTKVNNAIIEIDSSPKQRFVAINGTYEFDIPIGKYKITSFYKNDEGVMTTEENITIKDNGIYILDLFLYPDFGEEELYSGLDFDISQPYPEKEKSFVWLLVPILFVMLVFLLILIKVNTRIMKKEIQLEIKTEDEQLEKIITLLRKNSNRMTQKEIRKEIPLSEAKISLMIAELESIGKVKKIKKGRGNIIVLNNKK